MWLPAQGNRMTYIIAHVEQLCFGAFAIVWIVFRQIHPRLRNNNRNIGTYNGGYRIWR